MTAHIDRIIREPERRKLTGISKTTWWRLTKKGMAPQAVKLSSNAVGWFQSDIEAWLNNRRNCSVTEQADD